jgi:hypothetical protein
LFREQQGLELAATVENRAIGLDGMQLGAAGDGLADRVHLLADAAFCQ